MTAANQQDPKKTGGGDGGIAQRINDYCDKAVENLKAGRLEEAYRYARKALEMDGKDAKAAALRLYTLYALDQEKRLLDKATALGDETGQFMEAADYDKAHELLTLASMWYGDPGTLFLRAIVNSKHGCFDLAYLDVAEALAAGMDGYVVVEFQKSRLRSLGFNVPQVIEPQLRRRVDEVPAHSPRVNLPNGVRVENLLVRLHRGNAEVLNDTDFAPLMPPIPLGQLARFLNEQVQGAMENLVFRGGEGHEDAMLRLLDEVTVPGRLHATKLVFRDLLHLPWAGVKRILEGRTLRAKRISFNRLQLPSGVDPNELLKLPAIRDCPVLSLHLYDEHRPQLPRPPPPRFKNTALVEWLEWSAGEEQRKLRITRDYLSSGLLGFLDALKKDFQQATLAHSYRMTIHCPNFDVADGLGMRDVMLFNRLGEGMAISVGEVKVKRFPAI